METSQKERKHRYHVFLFPSVKKRLRIAAIERETSVSGLLCEAVMVGLDAIESKPTRAKPGR